MDEHIVDLAEAYWAGHLDVERRAAVEAHLGACPACRDAFEAIGVAVKALGTWQPPRALAAKLEGRLVAMRPRPVGYRRFQQIAAALLVAAAASAAGYEAGRRNPRATTSATAAQDTTLGTYLLLLEEREWPPTAPLTRSGYAEWARTLASEGRYAGARKLTDESGFRLASDGAVSRPEDSPRPPNVSGWYLVLARNYDDALAIARAGPHLRYGSVLVRRLE